MRMRLIHGHWLTCGSNIALFCVCCNYCSYLVYDEEDHVTECAEHEDETRKKFETREGGRRDKERKRKKGKTERQKINSAHVYPNDIPHCVHDEGNVYVCFTDTNAILSPKYVLLNAPNTIPNVICATPNVTASFILSELKKANSFVV